MPLQLERPVVPMALTKEKKKKTRCFIMAEQPAPARYLGAKEKKNTVVAEMYVGIGRMLWLGGSGGAVEGHEWPAYFVDRRVLYNE